MTENYPVMIIQRKKNMCHVEKNSPAAMIRTGFWNTPRRDSQSLEDIVLQLYLLTGPERSPVGLIEINLMLAAARLKWDRLQVQTVMQRLEEQGEIVRHGNWLFVSCWWDHNSKPGPGLEGRIISILHEVPEALVEAWAQATSQSGIRPEIWLNKVPDLRHLCAIHAVQMSAIGDGTDGASQGATPSSSGGQNKTKNKFNTTTSTLIPEGGCGGTDLSGIELLPEAEFFREHLNFAVKENGLNCATAQNLADELSQRLNDQSRSIGVPIGNVGPWLMSLARAAADNQPIQNRGIELANRRKKHQKEMQRASEADVIEEVQMQQRIASREIVLQFLGALEDEELNKFVDEVCSSVFLAKKKELIANAVFSGRFPEAGLAAAEVEKVGLRWIMAREEK